METILRKHAKQTVQLLILLSILFVYTLITPELASAKEGTTSIPSAIHSLPYQQAPTLQNGWLTYYTADLYLHFDYPADWQIEHLEDARLTHPAGVILYPPTDADPTLSKIEIDVQTFELSPDQSLSEWLDAFIALLNQIGPMQGKLSGVNDVTTAALVRAKSPAQVLHVVNVLEADGPFNQTIWLTRGNLIYMINSYSLEPAMTEIMEQVAISLEFEADAPTSLNALLGTNEAHQSVEENLAEFIASQPTPESCDIVCRDARTAAELGIPAAPELPSLWSRFMAWMQSWTLAENVEVEDSASSPLPPMMPQPTAPVRAEVYQGVAPYAELPGFEIAYDAEMIELTSQSFGAGVADSKLLVHQSIPDCFLRLDIGPGGANKITTKVLAGREWSIFESGTPGFITYSTPFKTGAYLFGIQTPRYPDSRCAKPVSNPI